MANKTTEEKLAGLIHGALENFSDEDLANMFDVGLDDLAPHLDSIPSPTKDMIVALSMISTLMAKRLRAKSAQLH